MTDRVMRSKPAKHGKRLDGKRIAAVNKTPGNGFVEAQLLKRVEKLETKNRATRRVLRDLILHIRVRAEQEGNIYSVAELNEMRDALLRLEE